MAAAGRSTSAPRRRISDVGDDGARFLHLVLRFQFSDSGVIRHGNQEDQVTSDVGI